MTATPKIVLPDIRVAHEVHMPQLRLFSPAVCACCGARCFVGAPIVECPKDCPSAILHALRSDFEIGYFESERRSGKTSRLVEIAMEFERAGASTLFVVPVMSYAAQLRITQQLRREIRSFRSLKENPLFGKKYYVFVDEVLPAEMEDVWGLLAESGCVFVTGYFTNRD